MGFEALRDPAPCKAARESALEEMVALFPVLGLMQARAAGTLSGGQQQQQLALARVLVRRPFHVVFTLPSELRPLAAQAHTV